MARTLRMALDLTLYSINTARPFIASTWSAAKSSLSTTKASFVLNNPVVSKAESLLGSVTSTVESKLTMLRDSQLPKELKYLEEEIKRIKERISKSGTACKIMQSNMRVAWPYMKVECAPPMTVALLQGSFGESLENTVSGATNNFMNAIQTQINNMDAAVENKKQVAEAAIIAAQEKVKAEEQKKKEAVKAKMTKEVAAAKQKEEAKKAPEPAKKEDKKASTKGQKAAPVKKNEKKSPKKK